MTRDVLLLAATVLFTIVLVLDKHPYWAAAYALFSFVLSYTTIRAGVVWVFSVLLT